MYMYIVACTRTCRRTHHVHVHVNHVHHVHVHHVHVQVHIVYLYSLFTLQVLGFMYLLHVHVDLIHGHAY